MSPMNPMLESPDFEMSKRPLAITLPSSLVSASIFRLALRSGNIALKCFLKLSESSAVIAESSMTLSRSKSVKG